MKKEIEVKTPARKASVSKKTVTLCDICGKNAERESYGSGGDTCPVCKRDVCRAHKKYDDHGDDYPDVYCTICHRLRFETYDHLYKAEELRHEKVLDDLETSFKELSLAENPKTHE